MSNDEEDCLHKQERTNMAKKKKLTRAPGLHHSPSKRISLTGEAFTLMENMAFCNTKKRRITLEFTKGLSSSASRKISCKDNAGVDSFDGVDGKFTYKEV